MTTEPLTVMTHFGDIAELSAGLADRIDEERLILYGPSAYGEGSVVRFAVLLADETPVIQGTGRVSAVYDGGEARDPAIRFDVVFEGLELEGTSEVVFERVLQHKGGRQTGEVDIDGAAPTGGDAFSAADVGVEAPQSAAGTGPAGMGPDAVGQGVAPEAEFQVADDPAEVGVGESDPAAYVDSLPPEEATSLEPPPGFQEELRQFSGEATQIAVEGEPRVRVDAPEQREAPELPQAPNGFLIPPAEGPLTRGVLPPSWAPQAQARPAPPPSSGLFLYAPGALPLPSGPPRPALPDAQRVGPAPYAGDGAPTAMARLLQGGEAPAAPVTPISPDVTHAETVTHPEAATHAEAHQSSTALDAAAAGPSEPSYPHEDASMDLTDPEGFTNPEQPAFTASDSDPAGFEVHTEGDLALDLGPDLDASGAAEGTAHDLFIADEDER